MARSPWTIVAVETVSCKQPEPGEHTSPRVNKTRTIATAAAVVLDYCFMGLSFRYCRPCRCTFCTLYTRQVIFTVYYAMQFGNSCVRHCSNVCVICFVPSYKTFTLSSQKPTEIIGTTMIWHKTTQDNRRAEAGLRRWSRVKDT